MVRNHSFEASWGRPNCPSESVHRSLVLACEAVHEPPQLAVGAQQACAHREPRAPLPHRRIQLLGLRSQERRWDLGSEMEMLLVLWILLMMGGWWLRGACSGWRLAAWWVCIPGPLLDHPATVEKALGLGFTPSRP